MATRFDELHESGLASFRRGALRDADRLFDEASSLAPDPAAAALIDIYRAGIRVFRREESALVNALPALLMRRDSPRHVLLASYYLVMQHTLAGRPEESARYVRTLIDAARELDDPYYSALAYDSVSALEILRADYEAALDASLNALTHLDRYAGELDLAWLRGAVENNTGYCLLALSRYDEAVPHLERAKVALAEARSDLPYGTVELNLALAYFGAGRLEDAEHHVAQADVLLAAEDRTRRYLHYLRGEIAQRRGEHAVAREHFSRLRTYYPGVAVEDLLLMIDVSPLLLPEPD